MRVLHYIGLGSNKYGGLEKYLIELSKQLNSEGDSLSIIYKRGISSELFKAHLDENGIISYSLAGYSSFRQQFNAIEEIIRAENPDIIHLNFASSIESLLFAILGRRNNKRIRLFYTYHCQPHIDSLRHWLANAIIVHLTSAVLCVSKASAKEISAHFKTKDIRTLYLGVPFNTEQSSIRTVLGVADSKKVITNIAYHDPIKGVDVLIDAVDYLVNKFKYNDFIVLQVGYNAVKEYSDKLHKMVLEKGLQGFIIFLGFREDIPSILSGSDIYCQPSRSEGVPLSIMEACANKLPVVATDVGGNSEAVINNKTGYLCKSEDYQSIAKCLLDLLLDGCRRQDFGNAGYELAKRLFSIEASVHELICLYNNF